MSNIGDILKLWTTLADYDLVATIMRQFNLVTGNAERQPTEEIYIPIDFLP